MNMAKRKGLKFTLLSLHGLIRGSNLELGRDEDTGGQTRYLVEFSKALSQHPDVERVELITRQIIDPRFSEDYAQLQEKIADKAFIVRIPFGPKRYLYKAKLWPYMEVFVDQCLNYFKRTGNVPDVIHGHYADAGYGGGQLARLLGIPFVFTGHSLGRVKKERLLAAGVPLEKIEKQYRINRRIEAEEFALETCSFIVTSTRQEVTEQYEKYQNYVPERMEVIAPGVDLTAFHPPEPGEEESELENDIKRFLDEPNKPVIVAMARPDERKNLEMLVKVFGESQPLQRLANLVLIMGNRDDIRELPASQRTVITRILTLIDVYNLYGKVAYPKSHTSSDVPSLYRFITRSRGVFANPAMTEPFGLTLLEAAASGAPIVATNNGGPSDIIANCRNGILIDPFDPKTIEKALTRMLTEHDEWRKWSENGLTQVHIHYSWDKHVQRYVRDIKEVVEEYHASVPEIIVSGRKTRRVPDVDRLIIADIDNTLTGDDGSMREFFELIENAGEHIGFGISTGRCYEDTLQLMENHHIPRPEVLLTSVGTEIYYGKNLTLDESWRSHIDFNWTPEAIYQELDGLEGLTRQNEHEQSAFKVSYELDSKKGTNLAGIKRVLRKRGIRAKVMLSLGMFVDIIPTRAGSGACIRHLAFKWGFPLSNILIAGDSGNDEEMLAGNTLGVVVANYSPELERLRGKPRVYFATAPHAAGIIEGINYYDFLKSITIPEPQDNEEDNG